MRSAPLDMAVRKYSCFVSFSPRSLRLSRNELKDVVLWVDEPEIGLHPRSSEPNPGTTKISSQTRLHTNATPIFKIDRQKSEVFDC
jgi:hypothetical protein